MPQLTPFYFVNQFVFPFLGLLLLVVLCSVFFLPVPLNWQIIRLLFVEV